jgi:hypothetical protein
MAEDGDGQNGSFVVRQVADGLPRGEIGAVESQIFPRWRTPGRSFPKLLAGRACRHRVDWAWSGRFLERQLRWEGPEWEHVPDLASVVAEALSPSTEGVDEGAVRDA